MFMMTIKERSSQQFVDVFVVVFLLFVNSPPASSSGVKDAKIWCIEKERQTLLILKQGLVDDYGRLSSWGSKKEKADCCRWRGVHCSNRTGHVTMLGLGSLPIAIPLRAHISPSLVELQHLNYLDLSNNNFGSSRIPEFIGSLSNLRHLNLSYAGFGGTVPSQLGNLSKLQSLDLSPYGGVNVQNLDWLSHLSSLRHLNLQNVDLSNAKEWFQSVNKLPLLTSLRLGFCQLPKIVVPSYLNFSTSLAILDLSGNGLTSSSFNWLFNFSSALIEVDLSNNRLQGVIPYAFGNMISLAHLDLSSNQLEGGIPKSFSYLSRLQSLDLYFNKLNDSLSTIIQVLFGSMENSSLEFLQVSRNQLRGSLPNNISFPRLTDLHLDRNLLDGSFPETFGQPLCNLIVLDLSQNQITGSLPDLTLCSSLRELYLWKNQFKGTLSRSIGQLPKLEVLDVNSNHLEGLVFEAHLSNLSRLQFLDLSLNSLVLKFNSGWIPPFHLDTIRLRSCKLGPHFPKWLQTQKNFSLLDISAAGISATIPSWFWDLSPRMRLLNISYNQINGIMPDLSLKFPAFPAIDLSSNHFAGPIPFLPRTATSLNLSKNEFSGSVSFLCTIKFEQLTRLDLSDNIIGGELPDCWMQFTYLDVLNLANNNLTGKIPRSLGSISKLKVLQLRNNSFTGELPLPLRNCINLIIIDLGDNRISGTIPTWIGESLSMLVVFSLRSNEFHGSIPTNFCQLNNIQILDLSLNNISGTIPMCLDNFLAMTQTQRFDPTIYVIYDQTYTIRDGEEGYYSPHYVLSALLVWKGREYEYKNTLGLVKSIDLSSNKLTGEIPSNITRLVGLVAMNFSRNRLTGPMPADIGDLKLLESLDLSRNQLSRGIPISLSNLNFLSHLDLSDNNLSGRIPLSTQLQSLDNSTFVGNPELCGAPLTKVCPGDEAPQNPKGPDGTYGLDNQEDEDTFITTGFYVSMGLGFTFGFCGVFGSLILNRTWRHAYFQFLMNIIDWVYVAVALNTARLRTRLRM
ncbi:hypothetical protein ACSBR1_034947 [Camellia fascicularis]